MRGHKMRDGYKIIDMDTHVNPPLDILSKYVEPSFRPRLDEFKPYTRTRSLRDGTTRTALSMGALSYDRFPGQVPSSEDGKPVVAGRGALGGEVSTENEEQGI